MIKPSIALNWLVPLIALLAAVSAGAGLLAPGGKGEYTFTTLHGTEVKMFGRGLYQNDSLLAGAGFKGTDAVTLLVSLPLLALSYRLYRKDHLQGQLVMIGALFYFLYNGASMTFSASFNSMFLGYTALFSASLFATTIALTSVDTKALSHRLKPVFLTAQWQFFCLSLA